MLASLFFKKSGVAISFVSGESIRFDTVHTFGQLFPSGQGRWMLLNYFTTQITSFDIPFLTSLKATRNPYSGFYTFRQARVLATGI